jgi:hypothetical protein
VPNLLVWIDIKQAVAGSDSQNASTNPGERDKLFNVSDAGGIACL